jgi:hypothetical protein
MDENNLYNTITGEPTESYEKDSGFTVVLDFFERYLPFFAEDKENYTITTEKGLVQRLVRKLSKYLHAQNNEEKVNYDFRFDKEGMQDETDGKSPSVDLDIISNTNEPIKIGLKEYTNEEPFFSFELKILGVSENKALREKEYVIGNVKTAKGVKKYQECGGIERFKAGVHGNKLPASGIIGFVLKDTFENWLTKINNWIGEFAKGQNIPDGCNCRKWSESEKLVEQDLAVPHPRIRKYFSEHSRQVVVANMPNKFPITHFWVSLIL